LKRNGDFDSNIYGFMEIDDLVYDYDDNLKNQLVNVTDNTNDPKGFKDENNGTADYAYDANGNMIKDENKFISSIVYNHLNLPTQINFATGDKIEYLYNAIGQKKSKKVTQADTETVTDYLDGYQYTNEVLNFFPHAEGYVNMSYCRRCDEQGSKFEFNYVYNYTDHLGNIRVSYSVDKIDRVLKILEENHYYPFGLKHTNYNSGNKKYYEEDIVQPIGMVVAEAPAELEAFGKKIIQTLPSDGVMYKYKFQGQERQDELGLNWDSFKWRNYDYAIGRFMSIDPLTESYEDYTPYQFASNQPVHAQEVEGLENSHDLNKRVELQETTITENDAIPTRDIKVPPIEAAKKTTGLILQIAPVSPQCGYVGEGLDLLATAAIQWLGEKLSGSNVSPQASQNIQLGTTVAVVILSKGKNAKADGELVEQVAKTEGKAVSSNAARREAMRKEGIPTSQQPVSQSKNASGREYSYEVPKAGGGKQTKSVQQQTLDRSHAGQPHWEAGKVKTDGGAVRTKNGRPMLQNGKSKVDY
jgi:RHS repeat-associated protein